MYIENIVQLNQKQNDFVTKTIYDTSFSWYFGHTDRACKYFYFGHHLMAVNKNNLPITGNVNSPYYGMAESIFLDFCNQNNISVNTILRAAINTTTYSPEKYGVIHVDHEGFLHNNFIMYLNDFDDGHTYIFDDENNIEKVINSKKNKAFVFDGKSHAQGFCLPNQKRTVLVFTFL